MKRREGGKERRERTEEKGESEVSFDIVMQKYSKDSVIWGFKRRVMGKVSNINAKLIASFL